MVLGASGQWMGKNYVSALSDILTLSLIPQRKEISVRPEVSLLNAVMTSVFFCMVVPVTVQKKAPLKHGTLCLR